MANAHGTGPNTEEVKVGRDGGGGKGLDAGRGRGGAEERGQMLIY